MFQLAANWPFLLASQISRGKFFIREQDVAALAIQAQDLLDRNTLALANQKPNRAIQLAIHGESGLRSKVKLGYYADDQEADEEQYEDDYNPWANAFPGSVAIIPIKGTLMKYGTMCSYGTAELAQLVRLAADTKNIAAIVYDTDSGGGAVHAVAPMSEATRYARSKGKPIVASVDLAASAAYWLVADCNYIVADNNISAEVGSIGVMLTMQDSREFLKSKGITRHTIFSSLSTHKHEGMDEAMEGDYSILQANLLDPMAIAFQHAVKANRGSKLKLDTEGILSGRTFFADQAKIIGLIDMVGDSTSAIQVALSMAHAKSII
jgi:protease-4